MSATRLPAFLIAALSAGVSFAADGSTGAAALALPQSVKSAGMAGVSLGRADFQRAFSNPALLAGPGRRFEAAVSGGRIFGGLETGGGISGVWRSSDRVAAGLSLNVVGASFDEVDGLGGTTANTIGNSLSWPSAAFALKWRRFSFGLGVKVVVSRLDGESVAGGAGDLGAAWEYAGFAAAVALRNVGAKIRQELEVDGAGTMDGTAELIPLELRVALGYTFAPLGLFAGVESSGRSTVGNSAGIGLEWTPARWGSLRAGFATPTGADPAGSFSFGLSGYLGAASVDYAFYSHRLGATNMVSVSWGFGTMVGGGNVVEPEPEPEPEPVRQEKPVEKPAAAPVGGRLNLAIADLRAENVSAGDAAVMADLLRGELVKTGVFNVIEKQNMDKVLAEHAFQQTGCSSEECAVKLGKLLNVQRMTVGSFGKLMDSYILSVRVVNVETGAIILAESAEGEKVSDLRKSLKELAQRMARSMR